MIGAYLEWLGREVFLIRAGPDAHEYPCPWDSEVIAQIVRWWEFWKPNEPKWAKRGRGYVIFKGFVGQGFGGGKATREYIDAAVSLSNRTKRYPVRWMQKKPGKDPYWLFQTSGIDGKGRIVMTRASLPKGESK